VKISKCAEFPSLAVPPLFMKAVILVIIINKGKQAINESKITSIVSYGPSKIRKISKSHK